jgi:hypothetical protein
MSLNLSLCVIDKAEHSDICVYEYVVYDGQHIACMLSIAVSTLLPFNY